MLNRKGPDVQLFCGGHWLDKHSVGLSSNCLHRTFKDLSKAYRLKSGYRRPKRN